MKVLLINPPILSAREDIYGGIPCLPIGIAYLAGYLRDKGVDVRVWDAFGEAPARKTIFKEKYLLWGEGLERVKEKLADIDLVGVSVHSMALHSVTGEIIRLIKGERKDLPVIVGGAYPTVRPETFLKMGADFVVLSEGEEALFQLTQSLAGKKDFKEIDGLAYKDGLNPKRNFIQELDKIPFPAFDLLPLQNYWNLGYAHGPVNGRYMHLITSRGCRYKCAFCSTPKVWQNAWRARSPQNVVDEIEYYYKRFGITDFHIQDDAFTLSRQRVVEISKEIIKRSLPVVWKLPAGIKAEEVDGETLEWMSKSGLKYLSFSPESGSPGILSAMNKKFDYRHGLWLASACNRLKIKTQGCFILGMLEETGEDVKMTKAYLKKLAKVGLDEIVVFILCPIPGSEIFESCDFKFSNFEDLNFTPVWRNDFKALNKNRTGLYLHYFFWKTLYHPGKILRHVYNLIRRHFETKSEMTIYRIMRQRWRREAE